MLYPFGGCDTQPRITIKDVTLRNITSTGGIFPPGVLRCHESNPCTGMVFEDVHITGWWDSLVGRILGVNNFIVENMEGTVTKSHPKPRFDTEVANSDDNIN
mmetsp:Transcript_35006/g.25483  ORF Transcript_35006/g.25483 Transcript_35006/m.25483 type:complete len:102 (-) Transcript_35006:145-450(-)